MKKVLFIETTFLMIPMFDLFEQLRDVPKISQRSSLLLYLLKINLYSSQRDDQMIWVSPALYLSRSGSVLECSVSGILGVQCVTDSPISVPRFAAS